VRTSPSVRDRAVARRDLAISQNEVRGAIDFTIYLACLAHHHL
jgi:hypothetical protein